MQIVSSGAVVTNVTFSGTGSIGIAGGLQGFFCNNGNFTYNVPLTGTGGITQHGNGFIALYGTNTYAGGTSTTGGQFLYYNNNSSFGTGTITIGGTGMAFLSSAVGAVTISNNFSFPTANYNINFVGGNAVGSQAGTTYAGSFSLPSTGTTTLFNSSTATTVDAIAGPISGAGNVNFADVGTWWLAGTNIYTGNTIVSNGCTVIVLGSGSLGSGSYSGTINNMAKLIYNSSTPQTLSGVISGAGALTQSGSGTLTLSAAETYTGGTSNSSTLIIGGAGTLTAAGKITNNGALVFNSSTAENISGVISGTGALVQSGSGTLTLSAAETYTGGTSNGTTLTIGGAGTITAAGKITNNGTFNYSSSGTENISGVISGAGTLTVTSGTLTLSGANTYSGITTVSGGTLNVGSDTNTGTAPLGASPGSYVANQLTLAGGTLGLTATAADITSNRGITLTANSFVSATSGQTPSIDAVITGGFGLTKSAAGNLNLNGSNTFTGGLTITGGGVRFNNPSAAGTGTITVTPASIITLRQISPPGPASVTITNAVVLNTNSGSDIDLTAATGNTFTLAGPISGVGYFTRGRASGTGGTVSLTGSNTFSGGLFLEGGTLSVGSSNALGTGPLWIEPGANNQVALQASSALTGINAITNAVNILITSASNVVLSGSSALELAGPVGLSNSFASAVVVSNNNTGGVIISGPISSITSGIGLTHSGTNTLTLNGTNTYNGNTTISGGTLALGATGSFASTPAISVAAGATFDVSAISAYALGSSALSASGNANPASINGNASGTVDFGSQAITLTYDGSHPALTISQGTLLLNGNAFTVNGPLLAAGTYAIVHQAAGNITSAGSLSVSGSAIRPGTVVSISVNGGDVDLVIQLESPVFSGLTASTNVTYGAGSLILTGNLAASSPSTIYPSNGETISVTINGNTQNGTVTDTNGNFSVTYNPSTIPASVTPYTITYAYAGNALLNPTNDTSTTLTVNAAMLVVTASNQSKTYGQTFTTGSGSTAFSSVGLLNSETIGSVTTAVSGGGDSSNAPVSGSPYNITPSAAVGGTFNPNNYNISYNPGTLTVNPAALTVTADDTNRAFGAANPVFTVTYTNFVNGETLGTSDVGGAPASGTAADTNSDVGTYAITNTIGTLTSTNYSFSFVNGTLTVTNALSTNVVTADTNPALPGALVTFSSTLSAIAPSMAVPTNSVQFVIDGTNYGSPVFPTNGVATATNAALAHGYHTVEADYAGDTNLLGATNIIGSTNSMTQLINTPPVAGTGNYQRPAGTPLTIAIADLMTNASDADGDTVTFASAGSMSTNGATIMSDSNYVHYLPPATNADVTDAFSYTVTDNFGATNQGTVVITVFFPNGPSVNITSIVTLGNGTSLISFAGIPNRTYLIQATTNVTPTILWTTLSTNTAGTNGLFQYNDLDSTNFPTRYYRTSTP